MDLASRFDEILEMGAGKEVPQIHELAVVLILDVDNTPAVLAATDLLAINDDVLLTANNSEGNNILRN